MKKFFSLLLILALVTPLQAQDIVTNGVITPPTGGNTPAGTILANTGPESNPEADGALHEYAVQITCETVCAIAVEQRNLAGEIVTKTVNGIVSEQKVNYIVTNGVYTSPIKIRVFMNNGDRLQVRTLLNNTARMAAVIYWE